MLKSRLWTPYSALETTGGEGGLRDGAFAYAAIAESAFGAGEDLCCWRSTWIFSGLNFTSAYPDHARSPNEPTMLILLNQPIHQANTFCLSLIAIHEAYATSKAFKEK